MRTAPRSPPPCSPARATRATPTTSPGPSCSPPRPRRALLRARRQAGRGRPRRRRRLRRRPRRARRPAAAPGRDLRDLRRGHPQRLPRRPDRHRRAPHRPRPRHPPQRAVALTVVTGGGRGIGAAICIRLAQAGHDIVFGYRADEQASGGDRGPGARPRRTCTTAVRMDVADPAGVDALFDAAAAPVTGLVNNAGIVGPTASRRRPDRGAAARVRDQRRRPAALLPACRPVHGARRGDRQPLQRRRDPRRAGGVRALRREQGRCGRDHDRAGRDSARTGFVSTPSPRASSGPRSTPTRSARRSWRRSSRSAAPAGRRRSPARSRGC